MEAKKTIQEGEEANGKKEPRTRGTAWASADTRAVKICKEGQSNVQTECG